MTEGYLESRGIAYRTNDIKAGRPTLLFIHGLSGSLSAWYPYEQKFNDTHNIVTFDLRGHGLSRRWRSFSAYEIKESVDDIESLLTHLNLNKVTLVGHSLGTLIALAYVNAHAEHVESLILLAPTAGLRELRRTRSTAPLVKFANILLRALPVVRTRGYRVDYSKFIGTPDFDVHRVYVDVHNTGLHAYLYFLQHIYEFDDAYEWAKIAVPALIVHGGRDTYIPFRYAKELASIIPNAIFSVMADANHILVVNNIDEVTEAIRNFIG